MKDRSNGPWHHERTLLTPSYISLHAQVGVQYAINWIKNKQIINCRFILTTTNTTLLYFTLLDAKTFLKYCYLNNCRVLILLPTESHFLLWTSFNVLHQMVPDTLEKIGATLKIMPSITENHLECWTLKSKNIPAKWYHFEQQALFWQKLPNLVIKTKHQVIPDCCKWFYL